MPDYTPEDRDRWIRLMAEAEGFGKPNYHPNYPDDLNALTRVCKKLRKNKRHRQTLEIIIRNAILSKTEDSLAWLAQLTAAEFFPIVGRALTR